MPLNVARNQLKDLQHRVRNLTIRVYLIERAIGIEPPPVTAQSQSPPPPSEPSPTPQGPSAEARPMPHIPLRPVFKPAAESGTNLESRIASHWFNRVGIAAVLIGVSYFLKFAFDNQWIGPSGRVSIGLLAGIAVVVWSERFRSRGYRIFSYSLKALGIGVLYLSLWGAFQVYHLIPAGIASLSMLVVTAATAAMALAQDAEILAAFAMTGGFSTPLLLSTGQNRELQLFTYVAILDLGALALV